MMLKGWREGEEDDAVMEINVDSIPKQGGEVDPAEFSKQRGESAVAESCPDKVGMAMVGREAPPRRLWAVGRDRVNRTGHARTAPTSSATARSDMPAGLLTRMFVGQCLSHQC